jgi:hypothetical protein
MPKVSVPRKGVTPGELVTVLSRRLGPAYQVQDSDHGRVVVRKGPISYATIAIVSTPSAFTAAACSSSASPTPSVPPAG